MKTAITIPQHSALERPFLLGHVWGHVTNKWPLGVNLPVSALAATTLGAAARRHRVLALSKETQSANSSWDSNWDCRSQEPSDEKVPTASRHLILIRHGQYDYSGPTDLGHKLTELGTMMSMIWNECSASITVCCVCVMLYCAYYAVPWPILICM